MLIIQVAVSVEEKSYVNQEWFKI